MTMDHPRIHGNFVLLRAGALRLLVPQREVGDARYLEVVPEPSGEANLLTTGMDGDACLYAALSEDMSLLPQCPPGRFVAAEFAGVHAGIAWCWDELRVLIDASFEPIPLPQEIRGPRTPVDSYVELDGEPAFLCDADRICRHAFGTGA